MTSNLDLGRFVQRRQFRSFEQDLARVTYAYGVDVRRFHWLNQSMTAQTLMRALELRWSAVAEELMREELQVPEGAVTLPFLQEIVRIAELLRVTLPAVRLVTPSARGRWPLVTPLGNARNSDDWLVVDALALAELAPPQRAFLLAQGLGHIQCGHAALFMAHYVSHREHRGHTALRLVLRSFSRLAAFSADRAGLLAAGEFAPSVAALARSSEQLPPWYPSLADLAERKRALEEFNHSRVVARVRSSRRFVQDHPSVHELVDQLMHASEPVALPVDKTSEPAKATPPPIAAGYEVPADAWPLARCDQRLTLRLGVL
ncbi:hypothetical protein [Nannocystis sp.]|uniref:hypothetical protein n=1 Tax=Nannocystis sp. TaxID=1962667 RepID=UPI002427A9B2|nr:hypothetical protein [Nannocystis sp.]MBK7824705.1 hypothetical protein [Nannocystis sp.]MBK9753045.1 hypothetical protein [Nannocystis sp.]